MGNPLFDRRAASELGAARLSIDFEEEISSFDRLSAAVASDLSALEDDQAPKNWRESRVSGRLVFGFAAQQPRVATLTGHVNATVDAVCQRCLEPFSVGLSAELKFLFPAPGEDAQGQDGFDVWELDEPTFRPVDIIDEVLVMAMPISARHDKEDCAAAGSEPAAAEETTRPFANLREQMAQEDNQG